MNMNRSSAAANQERAVQVLSGWMMLLVVIGICVLDAAIVLTDSMHGPFVALFVLSAIFQRVFNSGLLHSAAE
jgi:hypothetical protein